MHDDRKLVEARLERVLRERIRPAVHPVTTPLAVEIWSTAGEPVPVAEGLAAPTTPITPGTPWGLPWGTSWFSVTGTVPAEWAGRTVEAVLDLGFTPRTPGFQCEGLVYRPDGTPVKGLHPRNAYVRVGSPVTGGEKVHWRIEAASNPDLDGSGVPFQPTPMGEKATAGEAPPVRARRTAAGRLRRDGVEPGHGPGSPRRADGGAARRRGAPLGDPARGRPRPGRRRPAGRERHSPGGT